MSNHSKFSVMDLYIDYKISKEGYANGAFLSLKESLFKLFGNGYDIYSTPICITVPRGSDFVEIDDALTQEFRKHPELKGMRFQLQVCRGMLIV